MKTIPLSKVCLILAFTFLSSYAFSYDPQKCFKVIHGNGLFYDYQFPGYLSKEYLTKKHGSTMAPAVSSLQSSLAAIDPSVTTGRFVSTGQFSSSLGGGCDYFSQLKKERIEYLSRHKKDVLEQIALGRGPHLRALYYFHSCLDGSLLTFKGLLQKNYAELLEESAEKLDNKVIDVLKTSTDLLSMCQLG